MELIQTKQDSIEHNVLAVLCIVVLSGYSLLFVSLDYRMNGPDVTLNIAVDWKRGQ